MRLRVPSDFRGELVIGKLNIRRDNTFTVPDNEILSPEIIGAINAGYLVIEEQPSVEPYTDPDPVEPEYSSITIKVKNISGRELNIESLSFAKNEIKVITEEQLANLPIYQSMDSGMLEIVVDEITPDQPAKENDTIELPIEQNEPKTKMTSWDFEQKKLIDKNQSKKAALNPMPLKTTVVDKGRTVTTFNDPDPSSETAVQVGEIDFLDLHQELPESDTQSEQVVEVSPKKEKREIPTKKERTIDKKAKVGKSIKPRGNVRKPKTSDDAMIEDIQAKPSEVIELIVNEQMHMSPGKEIDFIDRHDYDQNGEIE